MKATNMTMDPIAKIGDMAHKFDMFSFIND